MTALFSKPKAPVAPSSPKEADAVREADIRDKRLRRKGGFATMFASKTPSGAVAGAQVQRATLGGV